MRTILRGDEELRRLMTIPGAGEVGAMAVHAFAPAKMNGLSPQVWLTEA